MSAVALGAQTHSDSNTATRMHSNARSRAFFAIIISTMPEQITTISMVRLLITVKKTNTIAKHVYDKYGFQITDEDDKYYYMSLSKEIIDTWNRRNDNG